MLKLTTNKLVLIIWHNLKRSGFKQYNIFVENTFGISNWFLYASQTFILIIDITIDIFLDDVVPKLPPNSFSPCISIMRQSSMCILDGLKIFFVFIVL